MIRRTLIALLFVAAIAWPSSAQQFEIGGDLLVAQSVDETSVCTVINAVRTLVIFLEWNATADSGVVEIEEIDVDGITTNRASLQTFNFVAPDTTDSYHLPFGAYRTICTRISTVIGGSGASVTTRFHGG